MNRATRRRVAILVKRQAKKGIMPRKNDPLNQVLRVINHLYKDNTEAPEELQRPLSWKDKNKEDFFDSICMNRISGEIILVHVQKALDSLEDEAAKEDNKAYALIHKAIKLFKACLVRGHEYIVLDGNNRLAFYIDLLDGQFQLEHTSIFVRKLILRLVHLQSQIEQISLVICPRKYKMLFLIEYKSLLSTPRLIG